MNAERGRPTGGESAGAATAQVEQILFVCEGNVCRSPLAAALTAVGLHGSATPIQVRSAGTTALVGQPADPQISELAARLGADLAAHRATQLGTDLLANSQLVLTATRAIRSATVEIYAPAVQYTFTLRQFARIIQTDLAGAQVTPAQFQSVSSLRRFVSKQRWQAAEPADPAHDDIVDPYRRSLAVHEQAVRELLPAVNLLVGSLSVGPPSDYSL